VTGIFKQHKHIGKPSMHFHSQTDAGSQIDHFFHMYMIAVFLVLSTHLQASNLVVLGAAFFQNLLNEPRLFGVYSSLLRAGYKAHALRV
jgi:hypothetical protein